MKRKKKKKKQEWILNVYVRLLPVLPYVDPGERRQESRMRETFRRKVVILTSRLTCAIRVYACTCDSRRVRVIVVLIRYLHARDGHIRQGFVMRGQRYGVTAILIRTLALYHVNCRAKSLPPYGNTCRTFCGFIGARRSISRTRARHDRDRAS